MKLFCTDVVNCKKKRNKEDLLISGKFESQESQNELENDRKIPKTPEMENQLSSFPVSLFDFNFQIHYTHLIKE